MFFQRVKTPGIAHAAYVIGEGGEAAVVDPRRDVDEYLRVARENKLSIEYVSKRIGTRTSSAGPRSLRASRAQRW